MEPFFSKTRSLTSWKRRFVHTGGREEVKPAEVAVGVHTGVSTEVKKNLHQQSCIL